MSTLPPVAPGAEPPPARSLPPVGGAASTSPDSGQPMHAHAAAAAIAAFTNSRRFISDINRPLPRMKNSALFPYRLEFRQPRAGNDSDGFALMPARIVRTKVRG